MEVITGIQQCEVVGKLLWNVQAQLISEEQKTPELLEQLRCSFKNIIESKENWAGESREQSITRSNGERKIVQDSSFIIKTNTGRYFYYRQKGYLNEKIIAPYPTRQIKDYPFAEYYKININGIIYSFNDVR